MPSLREAEAAGNNSDGDVDQQLLIEWPGADSVPDVPLHDVPLPDVPLPDVPLPDIPLSDIYLLDVTIPNVALTEVHPDVSLGEE